MGKRFEQIIHQRYLDCKHMKIYSVSLFIREMQIKAIMRCRVLSRLSSNWNSQILLMGMENGGRKTVWQFVLKNHLTRQFYS